VSVGGYPILGLPAGMQPMAPDRECIRWYQFYFCTERGREGLARNRGALCELLWRQWSPGWDFAPAYFERAAPSFDNLDFVDVVVHGYRHRLGQAAGDPAYEQDERALALQPAIDCPVIVLEGDANGARGRRRNRRRAVSRVPIATARWRGRATTFQRNSRRQCST